MKRYEWLHNIGTLPKMISAALQYMGIKEVPGKGSNPVILNMAKQVGLEEIYKDDDTSWCALFINFIIRLTGKPWAGSSDPYDFLRAKHLLLWGSVVKTGDEKLGDVLIFDREGGGHVGLYVAESGTTFHVLGGNQSNSVSITEIAKVRLMGARRYYATTAPESAKKYVVDSSGELSKNEA